MTRIAPADLATVPARTRDQLAGVEKSLGMLPNLFRVAAQSPAALDGMLALHAANARGALSPQLREAIALAVAEVDRCDYCLSAHTVLGRGAGLSEADLAAARTGGGSEPRLAAATRLARQITEQRAHVGEAELAAARAAGFSDGELLEIIANVVHNIFTNYVNVLAKTEIDFPVIRHAGR